MKLYKVKARRYAYRDEVIVAESPEDAVKWVRDNHANQDFLDAGSWDTDEPSDISGEVYGVVCNEEDLPEGWSADYIPWGLKTSLDVCVGAFLKVGPDFTEEEAIKYEFPWMFDAGPVRESP